MNKIIITKHEIREYKDYTCLNTILNMNGLNKELTLQVNNEYKDYLDNRICDNVIYLLIPFALKQNYTIISHIPVTEQFLYNINEVLIPTLVLNNSRLYNNKIQCDTTNIDYTPTAVGTAITCGVDSTYTILKHLHAGAMSISHLFVCTSSIDLKYKKDYNITNWHELNPAYFERVHAFSNELNLPIVKIYSNYLNLLCYNKSKFVHYTVHHYTTMSHILALKKLLKIYYFASARPFKVDLKDTFYVDTVDHELLSVHCLTHDKFFCYSTGIDKDREQRTLYILNSFAKKYFHPCFNHENINCSLPSCIKCLRALTTLDVNDKLDLAKDLFNIDYYNTHHNDFLQAVIDNKDSEFLSNIYTKLCNKYPTKMKLLENKK